MRLIKISAHIRMGDRTFRSGDGLLRSVEVIQAEQDRGNTCTVEIGDRGLELASSLFSASFESGGITVPANLLSAPPKKKASVNKGGEVIFQAGSLADLPGYSELILNEAGKQGITDIPSLAYILATTQHETANTFEPVKEYGRPENYYESTLASNGEGYIGRGFVQITWKENYQKFADITGEDLVNNPSLALDPKIASFIIIKGMKDGLFSGAGLRDYISEDGSRKDYVNARRIVNVMDKAQHIAGIAEQWEEKLTRLLRTNESESGPEPESDPSPAAQVPTPPTTPEAVSDSIDGASAVSPALDLEKEDSAPSLPDRGKEIIITLTDGYGAAHSFHFIHTATRMSARPNTTIVSGQSIRWLLSRRKQNSTYQDITLRELAQLVCDAHGLVLSMDGDGPTYGHLDQTGLSDFGLLKRECEAIGFVLQDAGNTLTIAPLRPGFTGYVVSPRNLFSGSLQFSDSASADMPGMRSPGEASERKAEISPATGDMTQVRIENTGGTSSTEDAPIRDTVTGDGTAPLYGSITSAQLEAAALPTQAQGAIALSSGESVEAKELKGEVQRIEGYPGRVQLKMRSSTLSLVPGSIVALSPSCAGQVFARENRISSVRHSLGQGVSETELELYTPIKAVPKKAASSGSQSGTSPASSTGEVSASGWLRPSEGVLTSDGYWRNARRPRHMGIDLAAGRGASVFCAYDGTVIDVEKGGAEGNSSLGGGYGNLVFIESGQYVHYYCHLLPTGCPWNIGDSIKQGEVVGLEGNSGASRGDHLHWQIMQSGSAQDPAKFFTL